MGYTIFYDFGNDSWNLEHLVGFAQKALEQSQALGNNRLTFLPSTVEGLGMLNFASQG
jgi:hypothetical protein